MKACPSNRWLCMALGQFPAVLLLLAVFPAACSLHKGVNQNAAQNDSMAQSEAAPSPQPTPAASAVTVHIGYARRDDYLQSLAVDKFASATLIPARGLKAGSALVRFEGGEPVWAIAADRGVSGSLLQHMPGVAENKKFAPTEVTYGTVPKGFTREEPENSDPEPLERGKYYIFTVRRGSGSVDYQAVHITEDGTIESYDAQPRAGTSFALCCDIAPDFVGSAVSDTSAP
jgi:hypothetical protein